MFTLHFKLVNPASSRKEPEVAKDRQRQRRDHADRHRQPRPAQPPPPRGPPIQVVVDSETLALEPVLQQPVEYREVHQRRRCEGHARLVVGALPEEEETQQQGGADEWLQETVNRGESGEVQGLAPGEARTPGSLAMTCHTPAVHHNRKPRLGNFHPRAGAAS